MDTKSWAPTTKTPTESWALITPPPLSRPLIFDAKTRKYDWPILCTVPFCSGHFQFSSQCLDFDVTLKDRFPGARLLWRRKIADCDKLDGGVISGVFCVCIMYLCLCLYYVLVLRSTCMYVEVSSVVADCPAMSYVLCLMYLCLDVHKGVVSAGDASGDNVVLLAVLN